MKNKKIKKIILGIALFGALGLVQENNGTDSKPIVDVLGSLAVAGSLYILGDFLSDCKKGYSIENKTIFLTERKAELAKNIFWGALKLSSAVGCFISGCLLVADNHPLNK